MPPPRRASRSDAAGTSRRFQSSEDAGPFPASARVLRRSDFLRIQEHGKRIHAQAFLVVALAREAAVGPRLGMAVSRRVGGAVVRNRIRRLLREVFRRIATELPPVDLVVIAKAGAANLGALGLGAVGQDVEPALRRAARAAARSQEE